MSRKPYLRWRPLDYLNDTKHLSLEQHGAYMLLLWFLWTGVGKLPCDRRQIARMLGISLHRWNAIAPGVLPFFDIEADGMTQKRLAAERKGYADFCEARSAKAAEASAAKALKSNDQGHRTRSELDANSDRVQPQIKDTKNSNKESKPSLVVGEALTPAREGARGLRVIDGGPYDPEETQP